MIGQDLRLQNVGYCHDRGKAENHHNIDLSISLHVPAGKILGVIGHSGGGKSTLLSLIGGFLKPDQGHIFLGDRNITHIAPGQRGIASLFQSDNLFQHLTVARNLSFARQRISQQEIAHSLAEVGLIGFENRLAGDLSGGEKQRIALARLMLQQAPCLTIDEGFSALGPAQRIEIADLLKKLQQKRGVTLICVSHDVADLEILTDQIIFIDKGRIHFQGSLTEALKRKNDPILSSYFEKRDE